MRKTTLMILLALPLIAACSGHEPTPHVHPDGDDRQTTTATPPPPRPLPPDRCSDCPPGGLPRYCGTVRC